MTAPVAVVGLAWSSFEAEHDATLDELVFDTSSRALTDAGMRKADLDLTLLASLDLYEGRTISYGLTLPAAGGYLSDEFRLENDSSLSVINACSAIVGRNAEVVMVTAFNSPEVSLAHDDDVPAFYRQISNATFDPHFGRPIGCTGDALLGMHAVRALDGGVETAELATVAAGEINRGSNRPRAFRAPTTATDVATAPVAAWPLTDLMLPAFSTGSISVVLASQARARRCRRRHGWITGWGLGNTAYTWNPQWLLDPMAGTRRAASRAYRQAGVHDPGSEISLAEVTALSPALLQPAIDALSLTELPAERINPSGGVRSNFPGFANGLLRLLECLTELETLGVEAGRQPRGVAHASEYLTGTASANASVIVVEAP